MLVLALCELCSFHNLINTLLSKRQFRTIHLKSHFILFSYQWAILLNISPFMYPDDFKVS